MEPGTPVGSHPEALMLGKGAESLPLHPEGPRSGEGQERLSWDGPSGVVLGALTILC